MESFYDFFIEDPLFFEFEPLEFRDQEDFICWWNRPEILSAEFFKLLTVPLFLYWLELPKNKFLFLVFNYYYDGIIQNPRESTVFKYWSDYFDYFDDYLDFL